MAGSTAFEAYLTEVLPYAADCPRAVALNAVRNSMIEFCQRSLAWQETLDPFPVEVEEGVYPLALPPKSQLVTVVQGYIGDRLLIPKKVDELARLFRMLNWRELSGHPMYVTHDTSEEVLLVPKPQHAGYADVTLRVALAPSRDATTAPTWLYARYLEAIAQGALARLRSLPGQPFSDPTSALAHKGLFEGQLASVRIQVDRSLGRSAGQVEFQRVV